MALEEGLPDFENLKPEDIRQAIARRVRFDAQAPARRLAQNIRTTGGGLRTSGVSMLPQIEGARQRASNLTDATLRLGTQAANQRFQSQEAEKARQFQMRLFQEQAALAAAQSRRRFQQALVGAGVGFASDAIMRRIPGIG